ncbi:MAG: exodeoxyribonuclease III [Atopobiaceae bacterium]|jgi:exodeoxyribonuclease-3|nr:exodeoxyribonuclease III [Atopobiaceae bacterium]MCH4180817.1 exodeoxyribonuclease III [Atopobiaceae bacterium]MCH4214140.1 exodeoxyribonuclease III [Atopobiaceae bacterium]MCH4229686.1 exodeoxyribonuclease III [Atopobiaceae bacterium]MCH4276492.1 exodeoxyribonuclease III [Atopobiaceae bacterium]
MSDDPASSHELRLVSWNVNGLRAVMKKDPGFEEVFASLDADVVALQETKLQEGQVALELPGYHQTWSYAARKGYSGTAVFSREEPISVINTIGDVDADDEGRVCALEFERCWFVDVYTPNAQNELKRIDTRLAWDDAYREFLCGLARNKPVITCGDFNVAHEEIDLKNPGPNRGNAGFSDEERTSFGKLLSAGFTDTFRDRHPDLEGAYSWWSYRFHARDTNAGWRIDYFLVSDDIAPNVTGASILDEVYGSDHCPVELTIEL